MALNPAWVKMENLRAGHDPAQVTTTDTPRVERSTHDPTHPLYAIYGDDPRETASAENGKLLVSGIVEQLSKQVAQALAAVR
jgi:creatinine amidohydrolase/Fe(II)-dependent formamide hydrolase-like protein